MNGEPQRKPDHAVVPAWWDPKERTMIVDPSTIVCGVLVVGQAGVYFASTVGIEFEIAVSQLTVTWLKLGRGCRLHTPVANYRIYLLPPVDGTPRLSRSAFESIAEALGTAGDLGELAELAGDFGSLADAVAVAGLLGDSLKAVSAISALRQAKRSREALEQQFAQIA